MPDRIPLYYTFGNHMHWVDMEWLWGYDALPGSARDMLRLCEEAGVKGNMNFDGIGYEKLAAEAPETLIALREAVVAGTIEVVGASYGQPYGLFHGGESNVRQRVYGVRAVLRLLGVRPRSFWEEEFDFFPHARRGLRVRRTVLPVDLAHAAYTLRAASGGLVGRAGRQPAAGGDAQPAQPAPVARGFRWPARWPAATRDARARYRSVAGADALARLDVPLGAAAAQAARTAGAPWLRAAPGDARGVPGGRTRVRRSTPLYARRCVPRHEPGQERRPHAPPEPPG